MHTYISILLLSTLSMPLALTGWAESHSQANLASTNAKTQVEYAQNKASSSSDDCTGRGCGRRYDKARGSGRVDSTPKPAEQSKSLQAAQTLPENGEIGARGSGRFEQMSEIL